MSFSRYLILVLVWALLVSESWVSSCCFPDRELTSNKDQLGNSSMTNSLSDVLGPSMRYYLKKYAPDQAQRFSSVNLSIYTEDPAGVDTVIMMYCQKSGDSDNVSMIIQDIGVWKNITMDYRLEDWYGTIIPISNISEPYEWCSYLVKYVANDTLGNWRVSPLCTYVFVYSTSTVDWFGIELYDTPDLWYVAGSINHTVTWDVAPDSHGQSGWPYRLYENGYLTELWGWGGSITINVDGLDIGNHIFELYLQVALSTNSKDTVTVHVVETPEEIPFGVSTGRVGPLTEENDTTLDLSIALLIAGLSFIVIILIWKKRRT